MTRFRKIWTDEMRRWLVEHKETPRRERYRMFLAAFPNVTDVTETAFYDQCSRVGAVQVRKVYKGSRAPRPLYSEQVKKGYVRIKIAQPSVWVSKAKWVYMETHPWEDLTERSNYIFLDGDRRNFDPHNIERVPLRVMCVFCNLGGVEPGRPEVTRLRLAQARLKMAVLDRGVEAGLAVDYGGGRQWRDAVNRRSREYSSRPENKERIKERNRMYIRRLKEERPDEYRRRQEARRAYQREWARQKRQKGGAHET